MTHISWMIVIAALIAALLQAVSHYFPWRRLLNGRDLPRPAAYIVGTLNLALPLAILLAILNDWVALIALGAVILSSGGTVLTLYGFDGVLAQHELKELNQKLEETLNADERR